MKIELIHRKQNFKNISYELALNQNGIILPTGIIVGHYQLNMHLDLERVGYHIIHFWNDSNGEHIIELKYIVEYVDSEEDRIETTLFKYHHKWIVVDIAETPDTIPAQTINLKDPNLTY